MDEKARKMTCMLVVGAFFISSVAFATGSEHSNPNNGWDNMHKARASNSSGAGDGAWVKVISPNGGELWSGFQYIQWASGGDVPIFPLGFTIFLQNESDRMMIARDIPHEVMLRFDTRKASDGEYKVEVSLWADSNHDGRCYGDMFLAADTSDDWFTINNNDPPEAPSLTGPWCGKSEYNYTYTASAADPENDDVQYEFDWGDGTSSTTEFYGSGKLVNVSHTWEDDGIYGVEARAFDGKEWSNWSQSYNVTIDDAPPKLTICKPAHGLYIGDKKIIPLPHVVIIGAITIEADATDMPEEYTGIASVEFHIDNTLRANDTSQPYEWLWDERVYGKHSIKSVAYDKAGNERCDEHTVGIFNNG